MANSLGTRVRDRRVALGMSQSKLARELGLATEKSIYKLEAGQSLPSLPLLLRISDVLDVSIDYLLGLAKEPAPPARASKLPSDSDAVAAPSTLYDSDLPFRLVGPKVQLLRQRAGWSQSELARRLDVGSPAHINRIEAGSKLPSLRIIVSLSQLFSVSTDTLLRDSIPVAELKATMETKDDRPLLDAESCQE